MKLSTLLIVLMILSSCSKKNNQIEIYLPKHHIEFLYGEKISKYPEGLKKWEHLADHEFIDTSIVKVRDSMTVFADEFRATKEDLQAKPFIKADEIIGFNPKTNELLLTKSASKKISHLKNKPRYSNQFVITFNKKPILNAYFNNGFTSQYVFSPQIIYQPTTKHNGKIFEPKNQKFIITDYKFGKGASPFINDSLVTYFKITKKIIE